jgi:hypothetical protein
MNRRHFLLGAILPKPQQVIPLKGDTLHVQGIDVEVSTLWVTSVDKEQKQGILFEFHLPSGDMKRSERLWSGDRFHPGGLMLDGDSLWIPAAEYRRSSSAVVQQRDKRTFQLKAEFHVADHIGAIAVTNSEIIGANWDAKDFYVWNHEGKLIRKVPNPTQVRFQDMKFLDGKLVASGLPGSIVWFDWPSFKPVKTVDVGKTDRDIALTHEGMTIRNGKLYLLPEDSPSRLFITSHF